MSEYADQNVGSVREDASLDPRSLNEAVASSDGREDKTELNTDGLQQELETAHAEAATSQDRYLRTLAEMDNFKKRIERTYAERAASSKKDLLKKLLSVKDNIERALQYGTASESGEGIMEGVRLTQYQLDQLLTQEGVTPIEAEGKPFDPRLQEAIQSVDNPDVPDHTVIQVVRTGYTYQGQSDEHEVLRPAQVVVNVHRDAEAAQ